MVGALTITVLRLSGAVASPSIHAASAPLFTFVNVLCFMIAGGILLSVILIAALSKGDS